MIRILLNTADFIRSGVMGPPDISVVYCAGLGLAIAVVIAIFIVGYIAVVNELNTEDWHDAGL